MRPSLSPDIAGMIWKTAKILRVELRSADVEEFWPTPSSLGLQGLRDWESRMAQTGNCLARNWQDKPGTVLQSWANPTIGPGMHLRNKAKLNCRCCAATVTAGTGRCHRCGIAYPSSTLRALILSQGAFELYALAVAICSAFWLWQ
jgi:hypothetical protein